MKLVEGIWFPDSEEHLTEMVLLGPMIDGKGTYQYHKLQAALEHVKQRRTALDIGMHVGLWAMHLVKEFDHVIGFEPVAEHRECLHKNLEGVKNYNVYYAALGNREGPVGLHHLAGSTGSTQVNENGTGAWMYRLDDYQFKDIDFIKIDVEGYEYFVVEGAEQTIKKHRPVIILEQKGTKPEKLDYRTERYAARNRLLTWGMKQYFEIKGDCCLGWQ